MRILEEKKNALREQRECMEQDSEPESKCKPDNEKKREKSFSI
jgi:hypothetical protein